MDLFEVQCLVVLAPPLSCEGGQLQLQLQLQPQPHVLVLPWQQPVQPVV